MTCNDADAPHGIFFCAWSFLDEFQTFLESKLFWAYYGFFYEKNIQKYLKYFEICGLQRLRIEAGRQFKAYGDRVSYVVKLRSRFCLPAPQFLRSSSLLLVCWAQCLWVSHIQKYLKYLENCDFQRPPIKAPSILNKFWIRCKKKCDVVHPHHFTSLSLPRPFYFEFGTVKNTMLQKKQRGALFCN